jgi:hypothetical protein
MISQSAAPNLTKQVLTVNGRTKKIRYATHNGGFIAGLLR